MNSNKNSPVFLLFVIPFWSFVSALRDIFNRDNQKIILAFSFLFGYSVFYTSGDITAYKDTFQDVRNYTYNDFFFLISNTFSSERLARFEENTVNTQPDFYAISLQFFVSRFTDNERWFFAIVSLIYTYFFLKFINNSRSFYNLNNTRAQKIFLLYFLLMVPFYVGVTGVRFWTALFIFMANMLEFIKKKTYKNFFYASLAILVHYTFFLPLILLSLYGIIKRFRKIRYLLMFFSVVVFLLSSSSSSISFIGNATQIFSETSIEGKTKGYTNQDRVDEVKEENALANWYARIWGDVHVYFMIIAFALEFTGIFKWKKNNQTELLEPFYILFFCVTLLTFQLGSIGRFAYVFYLIALLRYICIAGININNRSINFLSKAAIPVMVLHVLLTLRSGFYFVDPLLIVGNPIILFFFQSDVSLSQFIVGH